MSLNIVSFGNCDWNPNFEFSLVSSEQHQLQLLLLDCCSNTFLISMVLSYLCLYLIFVETAPDSKSYYQILLLIVATTKCTFTSVHNVLSGKYSIRTVKCDIMTRILDGYGYWIFDPQSSNMFYMNWISKIYSTFSVYYYSLVFITSTECLSDSNSIDLFKVSSKLLFPILFHITANFFFSLFQGFIYIS